MSVTFPGIGLAGHRHHEGSAAPRHGGSVSGREERFTRCLVTVILTLIALLTFLFSFVNNWQLCLRLGLSAWASTGGWSSRRSRSLHWFRRLRIRWEVRDDATKRS
jgi:hypothetical protein